MQAYSEYVTIIGYIGGLSCVLKACQVEARGWGIRSE